MKLIDKVYRHVFKLYKNVIYLITTNWKLDRWNLIFIDKLLEEVRLPTLILDKWISFSFFKVIYHKGVRPLTWACGSQHANVHPTFIFHLRLNLYSPLSPLVSVPLTHLTPLLVQSQSSERLADQPWLTVPPPALASTSPPHLPFRSPKVPSLASIFRFP